MHKPREEVDPRQQRNSRFHVQLFTRTAPNIMLCPQPKQTIQKVRMRERILTIFGIRVCKSDQKNSLVLSVKKDPELRWKTRIDEYGNIPALPFRRVAVDSSHCDDTATRSIDIHSEERDTTKIDGTKTRTA